MPQRLAHQYVHGKFGISNELLTKYALEKKAYLDAKSKKQRISNISLASILHDISQIDSITSFRILFSHLVDKDPVFHNYDALVRMLKFPELEKYRKTIITYIIKELEKPDAYMSVDYAGKLLEKLVMDSESAYYIAILLKGTTNPNVQRCLINVLGNAIDETTFRFIVPFLDSKDPLVRGAAYIAVTKRVPTFGADNCITFLKDPKYFVRPHLNQNYAVLRIKVLRALELFFKNTRVDLKKKKEILTQLIESVIDSKMIPVHNRFYIVFHEAVSSEPIKSMLKYLPRELYQKLLKWKVTPRFRT